MDNPNEEVKDPEVTETTPVEESPVEEETKTEEPVEETPEESAPADPEPKEEEKKEEKAEEKTDETKVQELIHFIVKWIVKIPDIITKGLIPTIKGIDWMNVPVYTYVRWAMAIILALNSALTALGINPIKASESSLYEVISNILSFLSMFVLIMNTYKNNSTSKEALLADQLMKALKMAEAYKENDAIDSIHDIINGLVTGEIPEGLLDDEEDVELDIVEGNPEGEGSPAIPDAPVEFPVEENMEEDVPAEDIPEE